MDNEQLVARINAGVDTADNMLLLYQQNKGLIYTIAKKYSGLAEMDDLVQEGYIALCEAVNHYEASAGVKFSSYAGTVIRRHMQRYIHGNSSASMPEYISALVHQHRQLCNAFRTRYDRKPTDREICQYLELNGKELALLKKAIEISCTTSLDVAISEDNGETTLCDMIKADCDTEQEVLERVQQEQLKETIWKAVESLPERQANVIRKRYAEGKTLQATGESIGITKERVRQEEYKAFRALRNPRKFERLHSFADDVIYNQALHGNGVGRFNNTWTSSTENVALKMITKGWDDELRKLKSGIY